MRARIGRADDPGATSVSASPDAGQPVGEVPPDLWQPTFDQLWAVCLERMRQRATISYKDVVAQIPVLGIPRSRSLGVMLSRLGALPGGQALLSTVVVYSCRPGSGRGWYRKARQRGYQFPGYTCIRVWRAERDLLHSEADRLLGWVVHRDG